MKKEIDEENNLHFTVNLDKLEQDDINFFNEFYSKMFNNVMLLAMRDLTTYDATDVFRRLGFSLVVGEGKIYLRELKSNKRFHFKY